MSSIIIYQSYEGSTCEHQHILTKSRRKIYIVVAFITVSHSILIV